MASSTEEPCCEPPELGDGRLLQTDHPAGADREALRPAVGVVSGLVIGIALWVLIGCIAYAVFR